MRIYFCSDVHASRKCWKKFLNSATFYEADYIIVGGDITGKFIVPIVERTRGRKTAHFLGVERTLRSEQEVEALKIQIADAGQYACEMSPEEEAWYAEDQTRVDELFKKLAMDRVHEWIQEAEEKLSGKGVRVFVSGANDDFFEVDDALAASSLIEDPNGRFIELENDFHIMGMGWGNITPWECPRDISEQELVARIDDIAEKLPDPSRTIFNIHVPPLGSGLDGAPRLDKDLRPVVGGMGPDIIAVGSQATLDSIAKYQPLIGVHGHIHESRGITKIAGVPVVNPGSEYAEGILDGALIDIDPKKGITDIQLVAG